MELLSTDEDVKIFLSLKTSLKMLEKVCKRGNQYKVVMKSKVQVMQLVSHAFNTIVQT